MLVVARPRLLLLGVLLAACGADGAAPDALSTALTPTQPTAYYVDQANRYFDGLDESAPPESVATYGTLVARWEWPPWLYLTGFGAAQMASIDASVKSLTPATIPTRDCRAFAVQPFARCRVTFQYADGPCPIYEEFTFNDQGEMTFIEAWSDLPGLLPTADPGDAWAEGSAVHRLSTRVPGLGNATGTIDIASDAMVEAARGDAELADFRARAESFWSSWTEAYQAAGPDLFARGCGW